MNPDILAPGERCASTSNRNFEGRQGRGGRTHLLSPANGRRRCHHRPPHRRPHLEVRRGDRHIRQQSDPRRRRLPLDRPLSIPRTSPSRPRCSLRASSTSPMPRAEMHDSRCRPRCSELEAVGQRPKNIPPAGPWFAHLSAALRPMAIFDFEICSSRTVHPSSPPDDCTNGKLASRQGRSHSATRASIEGLAAAWGKSSWHLDQKEQRPQDRSPDLWETYLTGPFNQPTIPATWRTELNVHLDRLRQQRTRHQVFSNSGPASYTE